MNSGAFFDTRVDGCQKMHPSLPKATGTKGMMPWHNEHRRILRYTGPSPLYEISTLHACVRFCTVTLTRDLITISSCLNFLYDIFISLLAENLSHFHGLLIKILSSNSIQISKLNIFNVKKWVFLPGWVI